MIHSVKFLILYTFHYSMLIATFSFLLLFCFFNSFFIFNCVFCYFYLSYLYFSFIHIRSLWSFVFFLILSLFLTPGLSIITHSFIHCFLLCSLFWLVLPFFYFSSYLFPSFIHLDSLFFFSKFVLSSLFPHF